MLLLRGEGGDGGVGEGDVGRKISLVGKEIDWAEEEKEKMKG